MAVDVDFTDGVTVSSASWFNFVNDALNNGEPIPQIVVTGTATLRGGVLLSTAVSSPGNGSMYKSTTGGLAFQAITGTNYDVSFTDVGNANFIWRVPTGTFNFETVGTLITAASSTTRAGLNIPSGTAPTAPTSGDMWYDGSALKFRDGSTTRTMTWS